MIYGIGKDGSGMAAIKIGKAINPSARIKELQTGNPEKLAIRFTLDWPDEYEGKIHRALSKYRLTGEWFRVPGDDATEDEEIHCLITLCLDYPGLARKLLDSVAT